MLSKEVLDYIWASETASLHYRFFKGLETENKNKNMGNQHRATIFTCDYAFIFTSVSDMNSIAPTCPGS